MYMDSSSNEMEKGTALEPEFLQDFSGAGERAAEFWPFSDAEIADEVAKLEQGKPDIPTPKLIESTGGWLQRLLGGANQADSDRAMELAHQKYDTYRESRDIALVDKAFKHYMEASRGVQRREWGLLHKCTSAALARFWNSKTQQDLARVVRMGNETVASSTNTTEPPDFGVGIAYVVAHANKDIYLRSIKKDSEGGGPSKGDEEAFRLAQICFMKLIDDDRVRTVGSLSRVARMELGIMIVRRCRHKKVVNGLDVAIRHLEHALAQIDQLKEETPSTRMDTLRMTGNLTLAFHTLYMSQVGNLITYPFTRSGRFHNLNAALSYLERTRAHSERMKSTKVGPAKFQFMLGTLLVLQWLETKKLSDAEKAKTALETLRRMEGLDESFKLGAEKLLLKINTSQVVPN